MSIPPVIVARLDVLFETKALASHPQVAAVVEVSEKTLRKAGDDGRIVYRLKGVRRRCYARGDVEGYLRGTVGRPIAPSVVSSLRIGERAPPSRSTGVVAEFTAARAKTRRRAPRRATRGPDLG